MISSLGCSEFTSSPFKCLQYTIIMDDYNLSRQNTKGKRNGMFKDLPQLDLHVIIFFLYSINLRTKDLKRWMCPSVISHSTLFFFLEYKSFYSTGSTNKMWYSFSRKAISFFPERFQTGFQKATPERHLFICFGN
jgi:hypothetical protein